jgi:hypothetical protein
MISTLSAKRLPTSPWPSQNVSRIEDVASQGCGLADLWEASPVRFETNDSRTEEIISALFPDNSLLCCGSSTNRCYTRTREEWRGRLADQQFIVPSPMISFRGRTWAGKSSARSSDNVGERRFLVVEFDFKEVVNGAETSFAPTLRRLRERGIDMGDLSASLLGHLAERAPLTRVVHSGGKSLHGWFYCHGVALPLQRRFMEYAVSLGADRNTWTRCQFVRMPDGKRDNGKMQRVFFFKPEAIR